MCFLFPGMPFTAESARAIHADRRAQLRNLLVDNERLRRGGAELRTIIGARDAELRRLRVRIIELEV